jgi:hypothetical protein
MASSSTTGSPDILEDGLFHSKATSPRQAVLIKTGALTFCNIESNYFVLCKELPENLRHFFFMAHPVNLSGKRTLQFLEKPHVENLRQSQFSSYRYLM